MATYIKTPQGAFYQQGQNGLVQVSDPVALRDLYAGRTPYQTQTDTSADTFAVPAANPTMNPSPAPTEGTAAMPPFTQGGTAPGGDSTSSAPPDSNPYHIFSSNLMGLLSSAQKAGDTTGLMRSKEDLKNESLNLSNPMNDTPYKSIFGMMKPSDSVAAQGDTQQAFQPGLTSISDQITNEDSLLKDYEGAVQTAYDVNKPITVGNNLVSPAGDLLYQGAKYISAVNPMTGLPDPLNTSTGQYASQEGGTGGGTGNSGTTVGGIDFSGQATGVGAYASDPAYAHKIGSIYSDINSTIPDFSSNADAVNKYIQNNATTTSPITGDMILNAAHTAGVDPAILASVLNLESGFGTVGVGARTNNPGNVGNTDSGATKSFPTWQDGVNATAHELARRTSSSQTLADAPLDGSGGGTLPSGLPIPPKDANGNYLPTGNKLVDTAQLLVQGDEVPSQIPSRTSSGSDKQMYITIANQLSQAEYGVPFSATDAEAAFKFRNSTTYQTYMASAPNAVRVIGQITDDLQKIAQNHPHFIAAGGAGFLNSPALSALAFMGDADAKDLESKLAQSGDDIGKLLGSGTGSDFKIKLGSLIFNTDGSVNQVDRVAQSLAQNISLKMGDYYRAAGVGGQAKPYVTKDLTMLGLMPSVTNNQSGGGSGSTGGVTVSAGGKTYTFPDAASAAKFKQEAGVQ